jgi:hypothetical protein
MQALATVLMVQDRVIPRQPQAALMGQITELAFVHQPQTSMCSSLTLWPVLSRLTLEFGFLFPPMVLLGHFPTIQSNKNLREVDEF